MHALIEIRHTQNAKSTGLRLKQLLITKTNNGSMVSLLNFAYKLQGWKTWGAEGAIAPPLYKVEG